MATKTTPPTCPHDCGRKIYARLLCAPHYAQAYRAEKRGEPFVPRPIRGPTSVAREVLSIRVSPRAKARAAADSEGARGSIEKWASR